MTIRRHRFMPLLLVCACSVLPPACRRSEAPAPETPPAQAAAPAPAEESPHWDYGRQVGPSAWGGLSPKFAACRDGRSQSPIDIAAPAASPDLPALSASYSPAALQIAHHEHMADIENTGHSVQVTYAGADSLTVGGETFPLLQYHFHSPSEHTVAGRHYPMEMHLVHRSADNRLAVIGVFIEEGAANPAFDPIWSNLPAQKGVETHLEHVQVDVDDLLPASRVTYRYDGSLTTPPCSEGVKWFVMQAPVSLSAPQIESFRAVMHGNNRPVQPLNGRQVLAERMREQG